jgi:hypothetical protein
MKTLWQRLVSRCKRIREEVRQVELEMAKEESQDCSYDIFPKRPYKITTVVMFWVLMFFVAVACWAFLKNL